MPGRIARSTPRPSFGLPNLPVTAPRVSLAARREKHEYSRQFRKSSEEIPGRVSERSTRRTVMSDQGDQSRLKNVGESLADKLSAYGLRRVSNLRVIPNPYTKGWRCTWPIGQEKGPPFLCGSITLLGVDLRRFWFGFQSSHRERVTALINELRGKSDPAKITMKRLDKNRRRRDRHPEPKRVGRSKESRAVVRTIHRREDESIISELPSTLWTSQFE